MVVPLAAAAAAHCCAERERALCGRSAFAQTAGAVRSLVNCGLRAIIDSSPNSLEPEALSTLRQDIVHLAPMSRPLLRSVKELAPLLAELRAAGVEDAAWAVLGGVPVLYIALRDALVGAAPADVRAVAGEFLRDQLADAIARLRRLDKHASVVPLLAQFRTVGEVPAEQLEGVTLPSCNKVLREERRGAVIVPADAAMALVLRHGLLRPPGLEALCALCAPPAQ